MNANTNCLHWREPNCQQESVSTLLNRECSFILEDDRKQHTTVGQRSKLTPKLTPEFYIKYNPRKGFKPASSDWIKGLVLNYGVNLCCYPKIKW